MSDTRIPTVTIVRAVLAAALVAVVVWFFASGTHRQVDEQTIRLHIGALGPLGPLVFIAAFAFIQPLGPSAHIFVISATLVWSPPLAIAYSMIGAMCSQIVGFLFYRYVAGDWVRSKVPERLLAYEPRLVEQPIRTVAIIRVFTFTWPLVSPVLAASRLRFGDMLLGTAIGLAPTIVFEVLFLESFLRWWSGVWA